MNTHKLLAVALTLALPTAALVAQSDTTSLPASASKYPVVSLNVSAESNVYFVNGTGSFGSWIKPLDEEADLILYSLSHLSEGGKYTKGAGLKAANPSGTLYGYSLGYDFKLAYVPGSFTVETSYRSGVLRDDSGALPFNSNLSVGIDDALSVINFSGDFTRTVDLHTSDFSFLTLWHPAGRLGDWLSVGFEYSHGEYDCDFGILATISESIDTEPIVAQRADMIVRDDVKIDDYLLHVRLGDKTLAVFAQGKCGITARADLAAGYSSRDDYVTEISKTTTIRGGVETSNTNSQGRNGYLSDTLIFKSSASLSFYYKTGANSLEAGAGFVCESDFGPDRSGETKGLMARLGYTRAW